MSRVGLTKAASEINRIVEHISNGHEGKINYTDFLLATVNLKEKLSEQMLFDTFKHFDTENKGYISKDDLRLALSNSGCNVTDEEIDRIMNEMQHSEAGHINFEEFKEMMLADLSPVKTPYPRNLDTYSNAAINLVPID
jgi:calcium-dependent protein kinase